MRKIFCHVTYEDQALSLSLRSAVAIHWVILGQLWIFLKKAREETSLSLFEVLESYKCNK